MCLSGHAKDHVIFVYHTSDIDSDLCALCYDDVPCASK